MKNQFNATDYNLSTGNRIASVVKTTNAFSGDDVFEVSIISLKSRKKLALYLLADHPDFDDYDALLKHCKKKGI